MHLLLYGPGRLGGAIATAATAAGWTVDTIGRPGADGSRLAAPHADVVTDASLGSGLADNVAHALAAGNRSFILAATGWDALAQQGVVNRHYDLEVRLDGTAPVDQLASAVQDVPGVVSAEAWGRAPTAVTTPGSIDTAYVYPDDSHGSFTIMAPPAGTSLISLPLQSGRWLREDDTDAVVLTTLVTAQQAPGVAVGDYILLTVGGRPTRWHVVGIVSDFGTQAAAYVTDREYAAATGAPQEAGMLRLVTSAHDPAGRAAVLDEVVQRLDDKGIPVEQVFTTDDFRSALDGHVFVLIEALVAIALVIALVGLLGLASAMSTSVTERTREYGVMHAIGATRAAIRNIVVTEGVLTAAVGLVIGAVAAVPMTAGFGRLLGQMAFRQPLPTTITAAPILFWSAATLIGAAVATSAAARRASRLTVREALTTI